MHKKQQDRKKRKSFTPELFERYFRRNEGTTDYATIPEVTLTGDFVIEFDVLSDNDDNAYMILGNNGGTQNCIFITNNDISVRDNSGSTVFSNGDFLKPQEFHRVKIIKVSSAVEIFIDGVSRGGGASSSSYIFNMLYTRQSGVFILPGILANLKIYDNGTLIRDYPLDDNSDILRNRATVLGGELWENPTLSSQWTDNNDGSYTLVSDGSFNDIAVTVPENDKDYLVSVDVDYISGSGLTFRLDGTSAVSLSQGNNTFTASADNAGSTVFSFVRLGSGNTPHVTISNISIRQADGYGTVINGNASDWGLFQQQATGEWLGQELLINNDFINDGSGWNGITGSITFPDNYLSYNGVTNNVISQGVAHSGIFRASMSIFNIIRQSNPARPRVSVSGVGYQAFGLTSDGVNTIDYDASLASGSTVNFELGEFGTGNEYSLNYLSFKEVLNVA